MSTSTTTETLVNLTIDGKEVSVSVGTTVYHACKQLGIQLPIFCYQDRMPPFGACRVCMVEVEKMSKPQTSCTLEAKEGMVVRTQSTMAEEARKQIIEFLLLNHPLDCPICDRGGECPLQENALRYGPGLSRFFEEKRHFKKALPLGPVLMLDRERCISCARCTRFSDLLSGDHALEFIERGYRTEVGTPDGRPAKSKFIGNTIMICPVGALTSQVYRFRARPWDNDPTSSTCTLCPVGCSMIFDARDGQVMRTRSCENRDVNDVWLCDKGWFGYEFIQNSKRLETPLIKRNGVFEKATWEEALTLIASKIEGAKQDKKIAAFGGNPLTFEENYLFQKLMRDGCGTPHIDHRIGMYLTSLQEEGLPPGMEMTIGECEEVSFGALLGLDLTEQFPVIWLRLRQAINKGASISFLGYYAPEISPYLSETILHSPGKEIEMLDELLPKLAAKVVDGKKGALWVGDQYLANPQRLAILEKLLQFCHNTPHISLNIMEGRGNSMGARLAGMRPDLGPFGEHLAVPGMNPLQVLESAVKSGWDLLYVAGANPALQFSSKLWKEAREKIAFLVVQDLFMNETAQQADVILPTLSFVEKGGSFINIEGRVQTLMPGKELPEGLFSDRDIFLQIAKKLNFSLSIDPKISERLKVSRIAWNRPEKLDVYQNSLSEQKEGALFAAFSRALFDRGVRIKHNPHLSALVQEPHLRLSPQEGKKRGVKTGDIVKVINGDKMLTGKVFIDETVADETLVIPLGFEGEIAAHDLGEKLFNGMRISLVKEEAPLL